MNIANKISTFRILSVPFFIACLLYYSPEKDFLRILALSIFILGVISDGLDGFIARKAKLQSKAGLILDPLGDKLLLMSAFIFLSSISKFSLKFPLWVVLTVISRDVIIIMGAVVIYMVKQSIDVYPTKWGKLTTTFQMLAVVCVLLQWNIANFIWWPAVIFTVISGIDYVKRGFGILYALDNRRAGF
ncbi:MAG: CDP-alcohol phosphatidyltransferase family protein [Candidatus Omnitrophica bacterium]|jgi:cardiolipin synthase|nr:CDP-alcohol phosphatidyltransferase family protein [Candidatus Omnitrophota bacterium]MDD5661088.1 CDP-alcohol phosphatidyltransferase family protein [Candidatus Omnitrophota bacterium]